MPIDTGSITKQQFAELLARGEGHFLDFKSKQIPPAQLTKALSAFANADGGELYVGVEDTASSLMAQWNGFTNAEAANGHIQALEHFFPLGAYFKYQFLTNHELPGLVLHCEILKTPDVRAASDDKIYCRRGAQSLLQDTQEQVSRLRYNKGITSYETTSSMRLSTKLQIP